jgi:hypothetical protein
VLNTNQIQVTVLSATQTIERLTVIVCSKIQAVDSMNKEGNV